MITVGEILGIAFALTALATPGIIWLAFRNPDASTKPKARG